MQFILQYVSRSSRPSAAPEWAIVLDHEYQLFVGSYRECEDWLDLHEDAQHWLVPPGAHPPNRWAARCSRFWAALRTHLRHFLRAERGCFDGLEFVLLATLLAALYLVPAAAVVQLTSEAAAGNWMPLRGQQTVHGCQARTGSLYDDGIEIACDLAPVQEEDVPNDLPARTCE
jgi:hypothetical protein